MQQFKNIEEQRDRKDHKLNDEDPFYYAINNEADEDKQLSRMSERTNEYDEVEEINDSKTKGRCSRPMSSEVSEALIGNKRKSR